MAIYLEVSPAIPSKYLVFLLKILLTVPWIFLFISFVNSLEMPSTILADLCIIVSSKIAQTFRGSSLMVYLGSLGSFNI